ncbi:MAG: class I tRNA ligase family protein [Acidiferrobacterales bacterium]
MMISFDYDEYICVMFPYPSGSGLHIGHVYNYAIIDSYCRYLRYIGKSVFQPFGYDAFGLPAENYARQVGREPREVTYENIEKFRKQMQTMNTQYEELLVTSDESYQEYTKWIFTKLHEKGLAYKKMGDVNYCNSCETVLAREQVKDGKCERCESNVETKQLEQWYFKITDYKDRLIAGLDNIDYPEKTKKAQRVWLEKLHDWCVSRQRKWGCPIPIEGETDTLDTFVDSSFYYIIYCIIKEIKPRPVDLYVGGNEHACMHLIYARFICMFLHDIGFIDFDEPFKKVIHQGMILKDSEKMSKSKGNTINPDKYDSRELRFYLMFLGHYFDGGSWSDQNLIGIRRFIYKWDKWMSEDGCDAIDISGFKQEIFTYTENFKFNKVVSSFMIFMNMYKHKKLDSETRKQLTELLNIYMPL